VYDISRHKTSDRHDVLRLQADAPVKNTGKTRYNSGKRGEAKKQEIDFWRDERW